ncbi:MAG: hypothetical protein DRR04_14185, partial [Gammaproteobacteria bacterium]
SRGMAYASISVGASYAEAVKASYSIALADASNQAKAELAELDTKLAGQLIDIEQKYINDRNMDSINGAIVQQLYADIGSIVVNSESPEEANGKIKALLAATDATFEFSDPSRNIDMSGKGGGKAPAGKSWTPKKDKEKITKPKKFESSGEGDGGTGTGGPAGNGGPTGGGGSGKDGR